MGALLKGARQHGWVGDAGELNRLLLDGKWLGKASLDHLLGDAQLGGLLLNNVGHTDWPVEDGDPLTKDRDWGWDNGLTSALGRLSLELSLEGVWDARATLKAGSGARLVDEVGESSKVWLITHIPGVLRSAERSPFMSPQRPTAQDFSSCGATTSTKTPLDKTVMPCSGTWTETTPSWNIMTMAAILPWTDFLTTLPTIGWTCSPLTRTLREEPSGTILASVMPERILTIFFSPETVLVVMATGICLEPSMRRTCSQSLIL